MKYYLDEKEVTLEELEEERRNLVRLEYYTQIIELLEIKPNAIYFITNIY